MATILLSYYMVLHLYSWDYLNLLVWVSLCYRFLFIQFLSVIMLNKDVLFWIFLQYAHRSCVQRWCNEKGNTMCEICQQVDYSIFCSFLYLFNFFSLLLNKSILFISMHSQKSILLIIYLFVYWFIWRELQQFKPGYTAPPPLFQFGGIPINLRYFLANISLVGFPLSLISNLHAFMLDFIHSFVYVSKKT